MLFNSFEYFLFLPLIAVLYYLLPHRYRWALLLPASYFFYMYWRPEYGLLLLISTAIDYWAALWMDKKKDKKARRPYLWLSLVANLSLLISFKYLGFINESIREIFSVFDFGSTPSQFDILLPVGISFYTFQTLSYTIDVYRGRRPPEKHFGIFALYVSFFPQLVAGPIERSTTLLPQFHRSVHFDINRILNGSKLFAYGLFKKIILADTLSIYVYQIFKNPGIYDSPTLILGVAAFGYQLYLDFSAYTDMAIGSAQILGFDLMSNFERPTRAKSVREFWSRWHISLTTWFFDYVYRPMAKNWRWPWYVNIIIVFALIGLWHGAGWDFLLFGLINAVGYIVSLWIDEMSLAHRVFDHKWIKKGIQLFQIAFTYVTLGFSLVFFRANGVAAAWQYIQAFFDNFFIPFSGITLASLDAFLLLTGWPLFLLVQWQKNFNSKAPLNVIKPWWLRWGVYYYLLFYLIFFGGRFLKEFIYFQF